ncbi:MAG: OmpA family protein, partial [Bacteroidaceae bacterium]|nr:OmpA family protein [Bacteroidaceae bacterium]
MKTRIILLLSALLMLAAVDVSAQSWVKKIKDKAVNTVKDKVEKKIDDAVGKGTDAVLDAKLPKKDGEDNDAKGKADADEEAEEGPQDTEAVYEQSDFVPGSVVLFEDNLQNEQMGEFPSKWDLVDGSTDV